MPMILEKILGAVFLSLTFWIVMFAVIFIALADHKRSKQNDKRGE